MDKIKRHLLLPLLLAGSLYSTNTLAQEQDFATDLTVGVKKGLTKRLDVDVAGGVRFSNNSSELDRLSAEGGFSVVAIKKWLDFDAGYVFIADWNGADKQYYTYRHRYNLGLDLYHKLSKRLNADLRVKWQSTYRVETDKTYKYNPKDFLRLKLGADYKIKKTPLYPYVSAEGFFSTNNPDGDNLVDMRYNLGVKYHISKHHGLDVGLQIDDEMNVSNPDTRFMLCVGYKFKF